MSASITAKLYTQTPTRMDEARSRMILFSNVFSTCDSSTSSIVKLVNAYIGPDQEQEVGYDRAIQNWIKKPIRSKSVTSLSILEARGSGLKPIKIVEAVTRLAEKELSQDMGFVKPGAYFKEEYFTNTLPEIAGKFEPYAKNILLAIAGEKVVGFLISKVHTDVDRANIYYVHYLAVDSSCKKKGIGTQLMLTAMSKAQELGLRLKLEFILDKSHGTIKMSFYESFMRRFAIPYDYELVNVCRQYHLFFTWDLKGVNGLKTS